MIDNILAFIGLARLSDSNEGWQIAETADAAYEKTKLVLGQAEERIRELESKVLEANVTASAAQRTARDYRDKFSSLEANIADQLPEWARDLNEDVLSAVKAIVVKAEQLKELEVELEAVKALGKTRKEELEMLWALMATTVFSDANTLSDGLKRMIKVLDLQHEKLGTLEIEKSALEGLMKDHVAISEIMVLTPPDTTTKGNVVQLAIELNGSVVQVIRQLINNKKNRDLLDEEAHALGLSVQQVRDEQNKLVVPATEPFPVSLI